jgi:hypothetical protein
MREIRVLRHAIVLASVLVVVMPALVLAQEPEPIDQPPAFAELRERFEDMKPADWEAAGYQIIPPGDCIASPAGGMGVHAINPELHADQFQPAEMDPKNPPILLLDATMTRVIGLEWEEADVGQEPPTIFGETVPLLPGHPGITEPHYMFHAYFRADGQVLFAEFDPLVSCELPDTSTFADERRSNGQVVLGLVGLFAGALVITLALWRRRPA